MACLGGYACAILVGTICCGTGVAAPVAPLVVAKGRNHMNSIPQPNPVPDQKHLVINIPHLNPVSNDGRLYFQEIDVTPQIASDWLKMNDGNRPASASRITNLAASMKRGEWKNNGQPINFSSTPTLQNGQHRLGGIVKSDCTVPMAVIIGVSPDRDTFDTIDVGAKRTLADVLTVRSLVADLQIAGHPRILSSALTLLTMINEPADRRALSHGGGSFAQHIRTLDENPGIMASIPAGRRAREGHFIESAAIVAHYEISQIADDDLIAKFWPQLCSGDNLKLGDPRLTVRNWVSGPRVIIKHSGLRRDYHYGAIMKAWNKWVNGESMGAVKFLDANPLSIEPLTAKVRRVRAGSVQSYATAFDID
jgi:hypothetical protein